MSVRQMVDQLTGAKRQLQQAKTSGAAVATTVLEAKGPVASALDGVQDKTLAEDIEKHAREITTELNGLDGILRGIDNAIQEEPSRMPREGNSVRRAGSRAVQRYWQAAPGDHPGDS